MEKIDKKGIIWFLILTFTSTYLVELLMLFKGYSFIGIPAIAGQLTVAGVMFFPGISAFIIRKFITKEGFKDAGLKLGKLKYYLILNFMMPLIFAVIYALTWIIFQKPDFSLQSFIIQYGIPSLPMQPTLIILVIFLSTITFAPFLNSTAAFGEEFGWRGYLLPKLLPMGFTKAFIISGVIWGLWHAPLMLMGYRYGNYSLFGIVFFCILLTFVGIIVGYFRLVTGSVFVAAFAHGALNAQAFGIWSILFPSINPLLGGWTGLVGIFVFALVGFYFLQKLKTQKIVI